MTPEAVEKAAAALDTADRSGVRLACLPEGCAPEMPADALAVQERVVALSGEAVAGYKIARSGETVVWGVIYGRDIHTAPARIAAGRYPVGGIEAEIAYRFRTDLPRGKDAVPRNSLVDLLEPVPVFEIVDSRFADYQGTPVIHRLCDRMSNGGLVVGGWTASLPEDFSKMIVRLERNGATEFEGAGGHSRGDPLVPALELIAAEHRHRDFVAGQILATGTFSGLRFGRSGDTFHADFGGRGGVDVSLVAGPL
jgi:2-keto-4-pentenoate hydratase